MPVVAGQTQISLWHQLLQPRRSGSIRQTMGGSQCSQARSPKAPSAQGPLAERPVQAQAQARPLARASALPTPARGLVPVPSLRDPAHSDPAQGSHERARGWVERVVVRSSGSVADSAAVQRMVPARQGLATQRSVAGWRGPCTHRTTIGPPREVEKHLAGRNCVPRWECCHGRTQAI